MTQLEILKLASTAVCVLIEKEQAFNDYISQLRIAKLDSQYKELTELILDEEKKLKKF